MNTSESPAPVPALLKIFPPIWVLTLIVLGLIVNALYPWRSLIDWQSYPIGIIFCALGVGSVFSSIRIFRRRGTELEPTSKKNTLLITDGPFSFSRNPIYLGMTLVLFGVAFLVGTLPMFLVPIVFFCIINFVFIPFEEEKMERQFGEQFLAYKKRVRRWI